MGEIFFLLVLLAIPTALYFSVRSLLREFRRK